MWTYIELMCWIGFPSSSDNAMKSSFPDQFRYRWAEFLSKWTQPSEARYVEKWILQSCITSDWHARYTASWPVVVFRWREQRAHTIAAHWSVNSAAHWSVNSSPRTDQWTAPRTDQWTVPRSDQWTGRARPAEMALSGHAANLGQWTHPTALPSRQPQNQYKTQHEVVTFADWESALSLSLSLSLSLLKSCSRLSPHLTFRYNNYI